MDVGVSDMVGAVLSSVAGMAEDSERVVFVASDGRRWSMLHEQDCCEHVRIVDVSGSPEDLVGHPLLVCEERTSNGDRPSEHSESWTWTFYEFRTVKGSVTLRWLGESNGYYGERVSLFLDAKEVA